MKYRLLLIFVGIFCIGCGRHAKSVWDKNERLRQEMEYRHEEKMRELEIREKELKMKYPLPQQDAGADLGY